jgi:hypothetical protein
MYAVLMQNVACDRENVRRRIANCLVVLDPQEGHVHRLRQVSDSGAAQARSKITVQLMPIGLREISLLSVVRHRALKVGHLLAD